jgi:hypothetical protein
VVDDPPGGRGRADRPEQPCLIPQARQVAQANPTVGKHHDQVAQHRAAVVGMATAGADKAQVGAAAKLTDEAEPVGQLGQQHHPGVAADAVGVGGDFEAGASIATRDRPHPPWSGGSPATWPDSGHAHAKCRG